MKTGLIIGFDIVGSYLAKEDDNTQAEFFRVFLKELRYTCETNYKAELQLAAINQKLSNEDKELIGMLGYVGG